MSLVNLAESLARELRGGEDAKAEGTAAELLAALGPWLDQRKSSSRATVVGRMRDLRAAGRKRSSSRHK